MKDVKILASNEEQARAFGEVARGDGKNVVGSVVYDGVVPPNSYELVEPGVFMSTPEFFLFRKVAESDDDKACDYICEMFGRVVTSLTKFSLPEGLYEDVPEAGTDEWYMMEYLLPVVNEPSAMRCLGLIRRVIERDLVAYYERKVVSTMTLA